MAAPAPAKLDVGALKAALHCGKVGPCAALNELKDCQPFEPILRSSDARFIGRGFRVEGGSAVEEITILRSKAVPAAQAEGALPARIAIDAIAGDRAGDQRNADKAIRAYERGDVPLASNTAISYLKERRDWTDAPALPAGGNEVYVASGGGAYLCAIDKQRLVLVRRALGSANQADGLYAILWPVVW